MTDSLPEALRKALRSASGDDFASRLSRASLYTATRGQPDLEQVYTDMTLRSSAELDLHLEGAGVTDHSTRADALGRLLARSATAVKELAKDIGGLSRHTPGLLTEAPALGSVRVVLRTPDVKRTQEGLPIEDTQSLDALALHQLASLMLQADEDNPADDALDASIQQLRGETRQALRLLGQAVLDGNWDVEGSLVVPGHGRQPVHLGQRGARRIVEVAKRKDTDVKHVSLIGEVDGWVWSSSTMRFDPDEGRAFTAAVPPNLQSGVAAIVGQADHRAAAEFLVTTTFPQGDTQSAKRSYALMAIETYEEPRLPE